MIRQRDFGEHDLHVAELFELDLRAVTDDIARFLQPLHADQARAGRQPDRVRKLDVRYAAFLLQLRKNAQVYAVELAVAAHVRVSLRRVRSCVKSQTILSRSFSAKRFRHQACGRLACVFNAARTSASSSTSSSVFSRRSNIRSKSAVRVASARARSRGCCRRKRGTRAGFDTPRQRSVRTVSARHRSPACVALSETSSSAPSKPRWRESPTSGCVEQRVEAAREARAVRHAVREHAAFADTGAALPGRSPRSPDAPNTCGHGRRSRVASPSAMP